jgi:hypothetical protein
LKDVVYKRKPHPIEEMKQEIPSAVIKVSEDTITAVVRNFQLQLLVVADNVYIENVFI